MHTNYDSLSKEELLKKIEELEIKVNQSKIALRLNEASKIEVSRA